MIDLIGKLEDQEDRDVRAERAMKANMEWILFKKREIRPQRNKCKKDFTGQAGLTGLSG
jgi:hypothetical protein